MIVLTNIFKSVWTCGIPVGYAIGHPTVITNLNTVRSPFNNTTAGLALAEKALDDDEFIRQCRKLNREQMERFNRYATKTNFIYLIRKRILY